MGTKVFKVILTVLLMLSTFSYGFLEHAYAEEISGTVITDQDSWSEDDGENLLEGYIIQSFAGKQLKSDEIESLFGGQIQRKKDNGSKLTGNNKKVFDILSRYVLETAAGQRTSTAYTVDIDELGLEKNSWTAAELGISEIVSNGSLNQEAVQATAAKLELSLSVINRTLMSDHPYEMYWYDKTTGVRQSGPSVGARYSNGEWITYLTGKIEYSFAVAREYSAGSYTVNTSFGQTISQAVHTAREIVSDNSSESDYEKLVNYRKQICDLTDYNHDAVDNNAAYGNPWQLVWIFDGEPSTKVVCEGYSKAFQYLCDLTEFDSDICAYSVSGIMKGGTGEGRHMWNIVTMEDGRNYLVDVTNCDAGTIGADDLLFLQGYDKGNTSDGYTVNAGSYPIEYVYDDNLRDIYSEEELVLSDSDYEVSSYHLQEWKWEQDFSKAWAILVNSTDETDVVTVEATVTVEKTAPTCTEDGKITYTATAEFDEVTYADIQESLIDRLGHSWLFEEIVWREDNTAYGSFICEICDESLQQECQVTYETVDATCTEEGRVIYTAILEFEGNTYSDILTVQGEKASHDYECTYEWAEDYSAVHASGVCRNCGDEIEEISVPYVAAVVKEPKCEETGLEMYAASFEQFPTQFKNRITDPTGHDYVYECEWAEDYSSVSATITCRNCDLEDMVIMLSEKKVDRYAAEDEKGEVIYTAKLRDDLIVTASEDLYWINYVIDGEVAHTRNDATASDYLWEDYPEREYQVFVCWADENGEEFAGEIENNLFLYAVYKDVYESITVIPEKAEIKEGEQLQLEVSAVPEKEDIEVEWTSSDENIATVDENGLVKGVGNGTAVITATSEGLTAACEVTVTHDWSAPFWSWNSDYTAATALFYCQYDSHLETVAAEVTAVVNNPTCTEEGRGVYTAKVNFDGREFTDVKETNLPMIPHDYETEYQWSEDLSEVHAHGICNVCGKEIEETAETSYYIEKEPICDKEGLGTYVAEFETEGFETQVRNVPIDAIGHKWEIFHWIWTEDYSRATAVFMCQNDDAHSRRIQAIATSEEYDDHFEYTASVVLDGVTYTDVKKIYKQKVVRIYGDNRYETSLKAAEELRSILGVDKFDAVVLTTGGDYADALSGSYLANINKAPVILIRGNTKSKPYADNVVNYIKEHVNEDGTVYILGGENAVPDEWLTGLEPYEVSRIAGNNRYLTNIEILNTVGYTGGKILVCTGADFADSLGASAVDLPILLVNGTRINNAQRTFLSELDDPEFIIIGGESAVSKSLEEALAEYGTVVERIAGGTRYETSKLIADRFFEEPDKAILAYGQNYPDGLSGGALAYALKSPLILADSTRGRSRYATSYCEEKDIHSGYVLGGSGLITDEYVRQIFSLEEEAEIVE